MLSPLLQNLIQALRVLPGVGPKSAQRMAFYLLQRNVDGGKQLSEVLADALENIGQCQQCHTLAEADLCGICSNPRRDQSVLCVVGSPADLLAIEQSGSYQGLYFQLTGHLSPIDGIGPEEIGIDALMELVARKPVEEVILANNPTVEGEATAYYIANLLAEQSIKLTRIAHGIPMGGELEYVDGGTLTHAFNGRQQFK